MNYQKMSKRFVSKIVKACGGIIHPQTEFNLINELVNTMKNVEDETKKLSTNSNQKLSQN